MTVSRASLYQLDLVARFGTWEWDLATDESAWSDELFVILALAPETALPGQSAYASALHADDVARVAVALDRVRREGARVEIEHRVRGPNKTVRFARLRAWRSPDGRRLHAVVEDTTQSSPISERLASVSSFAAGVAHEINNPLGFLSANLELLEAEIERDPEVDTLLREARHGINRIHTVVRGLMTFSRIEHTHREPLDLNRILEIAINVAHTEIRARAKLVRNFRPLPLVEANAAQLGQVFVNLLLNAAQAIPANGSEHEITVSTRVDAASNVVVEVRDTGRGIPRTVGSKVFEAFVTTKPPGAGPGLGLSVCRNLVHAAGGDITFESEPGKTVFRVVLPQSERTPTGLQPVAPAALEGARRGSVLIVDDEPIFASSLRRLLSREHDVATAIDGKEALARFVAGERFDAVISDLMMPGLGGVALYEAVADLAIEQAQRFVFVSAGQAGAAEFLAKITNPWFDKPCDLDALRGAIRRLVG